ncbi:MAG: UDP-3-O-[3-hydroxymyristoyl] N-acetylglucosamine deacetylase [Limnochordaceae bacterium]|nr:UDP-3-O-[3-hydroxymyristoyl] N-acetylglucosamine deacetylase [Limnochordaceae bacterium]
MTAAGGVPVAPGWSRPQRTIAHPVEVSGPALHGGELVRVRLLPAAAGCGILFRRVDLPGRPEVPAEPASLQEATRSTQLGRGSAMIRTVEHLLAAAYGLQVDNLEVEVDGPELPVGDGSARLWVDRLQQAGIVTLPARRVWRTLPEPVVIEDQAAGVYLLAAPAATVSALYVFHPPYPGQTPQVASCCFAGHPRPEEECRSFAEEIAPARTLAFAEEVDHLQEQGLGRGVTLAEVLVWGPQGPVTPARFPDEPARHKLLDLLGDFSLAGPVTARLVAIRAGHRHNAALVRKISQCLALAGGREQHGRGE